MAAITVPGMFLTGDHASRPAANAVGGGTLYSCTDHSLIYQSDTSSWSTWATVGGGGVTVEDEGTPLATTATTLDFVGGGVVASGTGATKTITIAGGSAGLAFPIDSYSLDGTHGDHFTGSSLNTSLWTRRNFTSGAETYQVGPDDTWMRIMHTGRAIGDGYFQTGPGSDFTVGMKAVYRGVGSGLGLAIIDTNGTGVAYLPHYPAETPNGGLLFGITTYTTYGGTYVQPDTTGTGPNVNIWRLAPYGRRMWSYIRKSGTNYHAAYSFDGEIWSVESGAMAWAGTVDRVGFILPPLAGAIGFATDIDWFNVFTP